MANNYFQLHKETYLPFEITVDTTIAGSSGVGKFQLPFVLGFDYRCIVDWGDGNTDLITAYNQAETLHTYAGSGVYNIKITGRCDYFRFNNAGDKLKLSTIESWGNIVWKNFAGSFHGCTNLVGNFIDAPILEYVTNLSTMFESATSFNSNISNWDVSKVQNFSNMFRIATAFNNGEVGNTGANPLTWTTTSATSFLRMFIAANAFNQNVGSFDVSNANLTGMFYITALFNNGNSADINNWDVSTRTTLQDLFRETAAFNQPLNNWDVSSVLSFASTFNEATAFNQNLGVWNVSSATNFDRMFNQTTVFNNGGSDTIKNWNVSSVTNMTWLFRLSAFNQPIGIWNVSSVTLFTATFGANAVFNQNLSAWNVSSGVDFNAMFGFTAAFNNGLGSGVSGAMAWTINAISGVNFQSMFEDNTAFNATIGTWNMTQATSLSEMFRNATAFDQDISSWNIINVTNLTSIMLGKSSANYTIAFLDAIYNTWSTLAVNSGLTPNFGTIQYTIATSQAGRDILTNAPNNWIINDGGGI